jgi:hypothetical protein
VTRVVDQELLRDLIEIRIQQDSQFNSDMNYSRSMAMNILFRMGERGIDTLAEILREERGAEVLVRLKEIAEMPNQSATLKQKILTTINEAYSEGLGIFF